MLCVHTAPCTKPPPPNRQSLQRWKNNQLGTSITFRFPHSTTCGCDHWTEIPHQWNRERDTLCSSIVEPGKSVFERGVTRHHNISSGSSRAEIWYWQTLLFAKNKSLFGMTFRVCRHESAGLGRLMTNGRQRARYATLYSPPRSVLHARTLHTHHLPVTLRLHPTYRQGPHVRNDLLFFVDAFAGNSWNFQF